MTYQVLPNKTIQGPDGHRFIVRGVTMFDYLLISHEARTDQNYRQIYSPSGKGPSTGISEPTYYARLQFINVAHVRATMKDAKNNGVNLIRLAVEPAVMFASVSYVDPADGLTYPSDADMLDTIIAEAAALGMVVQLQPANDFSATADNITFLSWLATRYTTAGHVWIDTANEVNGTNASVFDAAAWQAEVRQYVQAIRATGFTNPICIDAPGWGERVDLVYAALTTDAVFRDDPNLIVQPHFYTLYGEADFRITRLPAVQARWAQYIGQFCIVVGEVGIDNFAGRFDPNLDPGTPSISLTEWGNMQAAVSDFLSWCNEQTQFSAFSGVIGHSWYAYIPGMAIHDDNSMHQSGGAWSTWGAIFRNKYLSPPVLTSAQWLRQLSALQGRMGNGTVGTPTFQAEGKAGVAGASMFIAPDAYGIYAAFHRRDNNTMTGQIVGNGSTGVNYASVSDYRLKDNPVDFDPDEAVKLFKRLRPVVAGWKANPAKRELMFLAHEVQAIIPSTVSGEKDGPAMQTIDYGKLTPLLTAALLVALERLEKLEHKEK